MSGRYESVNGIADPSGVPDGRHNGTPGSAKGPVIGGGLPDRRRGVQGLVKRRAGADPLGYARDLLLSKLLGAEGHARLPFVFDVKVEKTFFRLSWDYGRPAVSAAQQLVPVGYIQTRLPGSAAMTLPALPLEHRPDVLAEDRRLRAKRQTENADRACSPQAAPHLVKE
jgi:hypothetical protein